MAAKSKEIELGAPSGGKIAQVRDFFEESKAELKKVTWPTKKEARVTSIAVLILVVVMSIFLGLADVGFTKLVDLILIPGA
jgi:preprotein translocase subunit SecE